MQIDRTHFRMHNDYHAVVQYSVRICRSWLRSTVSSSRADWTPGSLVRWHNPKGMVVSFFDENSLKVHIFIKYGYIFHGKIQWH